MSGQTDENALKVAFSREKGQFPDFPPTSLTRNSFAMRVPKGKEK